MLVKPLVQQIWGSWSLLQGSCVQTSEGSPQLNFRSSKKRGLVVGEGHVVKFLELQFFSSEFLSWRRHYSPVRSAMISDFVPTLEFFTLLAWLRTPNSPVTRSHGKQHVWLFGSWQGQGIGVDWVSKKGWVDARGLMMIFDDHFIFDGVYQLKIVAELCLHS